MAFPNLPRCCCGSMSAAVGCQFVWSSPQNRCAYIGSDGVSVPAVLDAGGVKILLGKIWVLSDLTAPLRCTLKSLSDLNELSRLWHRAWSMQSISSIINRPDERLLQSLAHPASDYPNTRARTENGKKRALGREKARERKKERKRESMRTNTRDGVRQKREKTRKGEKEREGGRESERVREERKSAREMK